LLVGFESKEEQLKVNKIQKTNYRFLSKKKQKQKKLCMLACLRSLKAWRCKGLYA